MIKTSEEFRLSEEHVVNTLPELLNCLPEEILFLDIETTGLSPKNSDIYLIGVAYFQGHTWHVSQFFAESPEHECEILNAFLNLAKSFKYVLHFNGDRFDIPFIQDKIEKYVLTDTIKKLISFDLYKQVAPFKAQPRLPDSKQKTIEPSLRINREEK